MELMTCPPLAEAAQAPESRAQLSASEPQEVKASSFGWQPRQRASSLRAASSSFFASRPRACVELGLPYCSVITLYAMSAASGQTRVVAALSR
mgnify:FL=1